jgi:N-succinyldiaminopimelate aminotransferase
MNPQLARLHDYPFQKLGRLLEGISPPAGQAPVLWSVGEPKHPAPPLVLDAVAQHLSDLSVYPSTRGDDALREAIARWLSRRFAIPEQRIDPARHVLPASGTREALFSIAQTLAAAGPGERPVVIMPNPFYQIYEGATLLAGAEPYYVNTTVENGYRMDLSRVPAEVLDRTRLVYVCSPGNPTGAVADRDNYRTLLELAERHDFVIASDECYSEIYFDESQPPLGLLQVASELGIDDFRRCLVFHSLSKRSNLPGLRSGFIAGDASIMKDYLQYRTYHGCTLSGLAQQASIVAWSDEQHVTANRELYRRKFDAVLEILDPILPVERPQAGFYLWAPVPGGDEEFTRGLYEQTGVKVLPGSFLSREAQGINPGAGRVRMALVASLDECIDGARRVAQYVSSIN